MVSISPKIARMMLGRRIIISMIIGSECTFRMEHSSNFGWLNTYQESILPPSCWSMPRYESGKILCIEKNRERLNSLLNYDDMTLNNLSNCLVKKLSPYMRSIQLFLAEQNGFRNVSHYKHANSNLKRAHL